MAEGPSESPRSPGSRADGAPIASKAAVAEPSSSTVTPSSNRNSPNADNEDRLDFNVLIRQLASSDLFSRTSGSSSGSTRTINSTSGTTGSEIWPLQLNTIKLEHYILGDTIGSGSYAEVRECVDTRTLQRCAVKIINKHYLRRQAPQALLNQLQEIRLLRRFDCVNVISMKECLLRGSRIYIILEYCSFVLSDLLNEQPANRLCVQLAKNLFKQLVAGIDYLHSLGIVHRDIKPQNLLIASCGTLKIIDFGVSQVLSMWTRDDLCSNYEGSPLFQAPEIVVGHLTVYAGYKVDVWAAGVTLYLMLFGEYPFNDEALLSLYDKILSQEPSFPVDKVKLDNETIAVDLLSLMLEKSHSERASIELIKKHPWLNWQPSHIIDRPFCRDNLLTSAQPSEDEPNRRDIYRSMTVLPYLHNHHFPNLPVMKVKQIPSLLSSGSSTRSTSPFDSPSSGSASGASSPAAAPVQPDNTEVDPHRVINERPIEWGTERQYKLLKVPQIRANRLRSRRRGRNRWRRRKRAC